MKLRATKEKVGGHDFVDADPEDPFWKSKGYVPQGADAAASDPDARWTLKSYTPAEYIEKHGDTPEAELSESVAENLALAREIVGG